MIFEAAQKMKKSEKGGGGVKRESVLVGSAEHLCSRRAFGVCKVKQIRQSLQTNLGRLVPCEQGAADMYSCYPFGSSADPIKQKARASDLREFVNKDKSFFLYGLIMSMPF